MEATLQTKKDEQCWNQKSIHLASNARSCRGNRACCGLAAFEEVYLRACEAVQLPGQPLRGVAQ